MHRLVRLSNRSRLAGFLSTPFLIVDALVTNDIGKLDALTDSIAFSGKPNDEFISCSFALRATDDVTLFFDCCRKGFIILHATTTS